MLSDFVIKLIPAARIIYLTVLHENCNFIPKAVVVGR